MCNQKQTRKSTLQLELFIKMNLAENHQLFLALEQWAGGGFDRQSLIRQDQTPASDTVWSSVVTFIMNPKRKICRSCFTQLRRGYYHAEAATMLSLS